MMLHTRKIVIWLLMTTSMLSYASATRQAIEQEISESNILKNIQDQVLEMTNHLEQFSDLRSEISKIMQTLAQDAVIEISGTDQEIRPCFVGIQGMIEQILASSLQKDLTTLTGFIHTPMPATPLCTKGEISPELVDPSLEIDPPRLITVKARTSILRDYLARGGNLYIVYPQSGLAKRTGEQLNIYKGELIHYPNHLVDVPVKSDSIPENLIGATYFFQDILGNPFVFAIQMTQANDPKDIANFGLWFGPINHPSIQKRVQAILSYMDQYEVDAFKKML